jgi:hypothetical protein
MGTLSRGRSILGGEAVVRARADVKVTKDAAHRRLVDEVAGGEEGPFETHGTAELPDSVLLPAGGTVRGTDDEPWGVWLGESQEVELEIEQGIQRVLDGDDDLGEDLGISLGGETRGIVDDAVLEDVWLVRHGKSLGV